jgi:hypothetical protein
MKTLKIFLAVLLFTAISFAQDDYTSVKTGEQIDNGVRPYKVYTALLNQAGTNAPVATIMENQIGNIIWSYEGTGLYLGSNALLNTSNSVVFPFSGITIVTSTSQTIIMAINNGFVEIQTQVNDEGTDNILQNFAIEIRVYP